MLWKRSQDGEIFLQAGNTHFTINDCLDNIKKTHIKLDCHLIACVISPGGRVGREGGSGGGCVLGVVAFVVVCIGVGGGVALPVKKMKG